jgi:hypothetical protein
VGAGAQRKLVEAYGENCLIFGNGTMRMADGGLSTEAIPHVAGSAFGPTLELATVFPNPRRG